MPYAERSAGEAANRSPTSRWTIASHSDAVSISSIVRRITLAAIPYGRFATIFDGGGSSAARSSCIASIKWSELLAANGEGVAQGWREADVQLDHVEMGDAGREIL
jgi:hypothetical protein